MTKAISIGSGLLVLLDTIRHLHTWSIAQERERGKQERLIDEIGRVLYTCRIGGHEYAWNNAWKEEDNR